MDRLHRVIPVGTREDESSPTADAASPGEYPIRPTHICLTRLRTGNPKYSEMPIRLFADFFRESAEPTLLLWFCPVAPVLWDNDTPADWILRTASRSALSVRRVATQNEDSSSGSIGLRWPTKTRNIEPRLELADGETRTSLRIPTIAESTCGASVPETHHRRT